MKILLFIPRFNFLLTLAIVFLLLTSWIYSGTYYISPTATGMGNGTQSNPFTIQQAISIASPGDQFYLAIGVYNFSSSLNFSKDGTSANPIKWIGYLSNADYGAISSNGTSSTLLRNTTNSSNGPISMSGDYNIFDKIIFQQDYPTKQLISVGGAGVVLDSCAVKYPSNASSSTNHTVVVSGVGVKFRYSHFYNGSRTIIWVRKNSGTQADFFTMEYCTLTHASHHPPIQIMPATNSTDPTTIKRPIVRNCLFIDNPYSDGVYSRYCEQFAFYNNLYIRSSIPYSIDIHTGFHYPTGLPQDTCNSKGGICAYNTIIENGSSNILFNNGTNQTHFVNNIYYSTYTPQEFIFRFDSPNNSIYRHHFDYNLYYIVGKTFGGTNTVRGTWGPNSSVWWSSWNNVTGQEAHTIVNQAPTFMNISGDDYSPLNSTSPQVGTGTPITIANGYWMDITTDYFGNPRNPTHPTMGAIEFTNSNTNYIWVNQGWNCISIPKLSSNMSVENLLPTRISAVYNYSDGGYSISDTLKNGTGYLTAFSNPQYILIEGQPVQFPISLSEGWNIIGPFEDLINVSQISTTPAGIINSYFYTIEQGYAVAETLIPGKGYWINVSSSGIMNFNNFNETEILTIGDIINKDLIKGQIYITDTDSNSMTLYTSTANVESSSFELPPALPLGIFDVRYKNNKWIDDIRIEKEIQINSPSYPIKIQVKNLTIKLEYSSQGKAINKILNNGDELFIYDNTINSIKIVEDQSNTSLRSFELSQNYPNPFNPSTMIEFALPESANNVTLRIYNSLGQRVTELVNTRLAAGSYSYTWNANNVATGVYIYELRADNFVTVKKMMLLK
jgi:hypothetical protein